MNRFGPKGEQHRTRATFAAGKLHSGAFSARWMDALIVLVVAVATLGAVFAGPALGDHEALVAQSAREMRLSGDWLVPHYLGEPYVRKPPLPYWLIAALSYVLPNDQATGLPVTTTVARLPSALAAFGTVMLLWRLASFMFGTSTGRVTAVLSASSIFFLLYAANATVEMILTFCCAWAHTHFWFAIHHPARSPRRRVHLFFFYLAMGLGMMAKGPFPLVMVAMPIAVWWYTERPLRMLARGGLRAWRQALARFLRGIWPRTRKTFTELWLIPGLVVFALCFVPWMVAVGIRHPDAWDLWNWQYWQRAQGQYEDTRPRGFFYYVPVIAGLVLPWLFLVFEAMAAPWIRKYARQRRALLYAGLWALVGAAIMSVMAFKKPYYVGPVIPGLALLLGVVAERFYATPVRRPRLAWLLWTALIAGGGVLVVSGHLWLRSELPRAAGTLTMIGATAVGILVLAGLLQIRGHRWTAFAATATTCIIAFHVVWYACGSAIDNVDKVAALARLLDQRGIARDAQVLWVQRRPDSRLSFYFDRYTRQMVEPSEIVELFTNRVAHKRALEELVQDRVIQLLDAREPVYLVLDRDEYELARLTGLFDRVHQIGEAKDPDQSGNDWIVISNVAPTG